MRTSDAEKRAPRRSHLNLIYFVDSARTRTIKIPLGRLGILLSVVAAGVIWSVVSVFIIVGLHDHKEELTARLESSLATIFEYESKHESVYETAYPANDKKAKSGAAVAEAPPPAGEKTRAAMQPGALPLAANDASKASKPAAAKLAAVPAQKSDVAAAKAKADEAAATGPEVLGTATTTPPASTAAAKTDPAAVPAVQKIVVSNPVLEARTSELELRFDVTNKASGLLAEGFLWAVAEFKTETGETVYIGAPQGIEVGTSGDPKFPERSSLFAIRRFKKKMFSFPFIDGKPGTFVGVKIGMMDKNRSDKMTYNVPIEIRVQPKNASEIRTNPGPGARQG